MTFERLAGRYRRTAIVLAIALILSMSVIVMGMVRYRIPGRLWHNLDRVRQPVPDIPLTNGYAVAAAPPKLSFSDDDAPTEQFAIWQASARAKLHELLALDVPDRTATARLVRSENLGDVVRQTLILTHPDTHETPAFLLLPRANEPRAALLVLPGHSRGIVATAGIVPDYQNANALALSRAGYVVLTIEARGFGYLSRMADPPNSVDVNSHVAWCLAAGRTALGLVVADADAALHYLQSRPEVLPERIGVVGFSSGGKAAIYLAALHERIRAVVVSGCVSSHAANFLYSRHDSYEAVPGIAEWLALSDCLGLIAPRPVLVHWGANDTNVHERCAAFNESSLPEFHAAQRIYAATGHADHIEKFITPGLRHEFDNTAAIEFLKRRLPPMDPPTP